MHRRPTTTDKPRPAALVVVAVSVLVWLCAGGVAAASPLRSGLPQAAPVVHPPTANVQVSKDASIITAEDTPTLARDPVHPADLVAVDRIDRVDYSASVRYSADSGQTWHPSSLQMPPESAYQGSLALVPHKLYAPSAVFDSAGNLYVEFVTLSGGGNQPDGVWIERSTDQGQSFLPPSPVAGASSYQVALAIDSHSGRLFVSWLQAPSFLCVLCFPFTGAPIVVAHSDDKGSTWSTPVRVSDDGRARVGSPTLAVDSHGNPSVVYYDYETDELDWGNLPGTYDGHFTLVVARSNDRGADFQPGQVVDSAVVPPHRFLVYLEAKPAFAIGANGEMVVAWPDGRSGHSQILLRTSSDNGAEWTGPVGVNETTGNGQVQDIPAAAVAPDGRIDVLYYSGTASTADVYLASSGDSGRTFPTVTRVSSAPSDLTIGPPGSPFFTTQADFGSGISLLSSDNGALAAWTDTRAGSTSDGKQDVFFASLSIAPVSSGPSLAVIILAALGAILAIAGIALLVASRRGGSGPGRPLREGSAPSSGNAPPPPPPLVPTPGQV